MNAFSKAAREGGRHRAMSELESSPSPPERTDQHADAAGAAPAERSGYVPYSLLEASPASTSAARALLGRIVALDDDGRPLVEVPGPPSDPVPARLGIRVTERELRQAIAEKQAVLLQFENGDSGLPIVTGLVHDRPLKETADPAPKVEASEDRQEILVDGKRVVWNAEEEIVLRCGRSSIVLRKDGKVEIKGKSLLSRSSGVNKIKGGSVEIN